MKTSKNILMLEEVAAALGELCKDVVFIGGATVALYIDNAGSPEPTPSDDVDFVIEITSMQDYNKLEAKLRKKGFSDPTGDENPPICRKYYKDIKVDVMPTDEKILGFSNKWYAEAIKHKERVTLPSGLEIYIFSAPYFLATKLVAYLDRGKAGDIRSSQDIEDICAILEGCTGLQEMVADTSKSLRDYIRKEFSKLLKDESLFEEAAHGFIRRHGDPNARAKYIAAIARDIVDKTD